MGLRVGIIHAKVKLGARRSNTKKLSMMIESMVSSKAVDLIILPSYPFTGPIVGYYPPSRVKQIVRNYAERFGGRPGYSSSLISTLIKWSVETKSYLLAGPMIERAGPRIYSTVALVSPDGSLVDKYRKISVTGEEAEAGISYGKEVRVFTVRGRDGSVLRLGVFVDEDLAYPELFRAMQALGANLIVGFMMPYKSRFFKLSKSPETGLMTMESRAVMEFLSVRSRETGVPIVLVGGAVDGLSGDSGIAYMPTIPVEPDIGVVSKMVKGLDDMDTFLFIEVDESASRPRPVGEPGHVIVKELCKVIESK